MKANIVFKKEQIALNNVEVTTIMSHIVAFHLNKEMENPVVYRLLYESEATIDQHSDYVHVCVPKRIVTIEFC
jgi:hypothetical protein